MGWYGRSGNTEQPMPIRTIASNLVSVVYDGPPADRALVHWACDLRSLAVVGAVVTELGLQKQVVGRRYACNTFQGRSFQINDRFTLGSSTILDLRPGDVLVLFGGDSEGLSFVLEANGLSVVVE